MLNSLINVSLKSEIPTLEYDFCYYCDTLNNLIRFPFPEYLKDFEKELRTNASALESFACPELTTYYRTYIIDPRLNILFAATDKTGEIATWFSKYGIRGHKLSDYNYGDGSLIGDASFDGQYNIYEMMNFSKKYGFLPIDDFSMAAAVVFENNEMVVRNLLSYYQVSLLMEKFHSKNAVDWKPAFTFAKSSFSW